MWHYFKQELLCKRQYSYKQVMMKFYLQNNLLIVMPISLFMFFQVFSQTLKKCQSNQDTYLTRNYLAVAVIPNIVHFYSKILGPRYIFAILFAFLFRLTSRVTRVLQVNILKWRKFLWTKWRNKDTTSGSPLPFGQQRAGVSSEKKTQDRTWTKH